MEYIYFGRIKTITQTEPHRWRVAAVYRIFKDKKFHGVTVTAYTTNGVAVEAVRDGGNWYYKTAEEAERVLWDECMKANNVKVQRGRPRKMKPPRIDGWDNKKERG